MNILENKKIIILGDRDGVPGEAIKKCVEKMENTAVLFAATECFVWTAAGAMDLENQKRIQTFANENDPKDLVVLLGAAEAEAAGLTAETVVLGDPTYAGCLAGVALGLTVYHVLEKEFKESVDSDIYDEQIGMMEMVLDVDAISEEMKNVRKNCKYL